MRAATRACAVTFLMCAALSAGSCGDSNRESGTSASTPAAKNVVPVIVDSGPTGTNNVNTLYTTVTVCVPGSTTQCQTIDHIQVDTGSYGLRILASVLTVALPVTAASDGNSLVECTQFVDGYSWGPVALADATVGGEEVSSIPMQIIGSANFATVPAACASTGMAEDTVAQFGANGILGIGVFEQDCADCATSTDSGDYYSCTATACNPIVVPVANQVPNPIPRFAADNNGSILVLPAIAGTGAATVTGSLIFGIDTESNNTSGSETVLALDGGGNFLTTYNGTPLAASFIDSGSDALFFNDTSITACPSSTYSGFYCPAAALSLSATLTGTGTSPASTTVSFAVDSAQTLATDNPTFAAYPTLAGPYGGTTATFDWGLPFFYGRRVANAIENHTTTLGAGPYVAF
jgi:hypothetical protein